MPARGRQGGARFRMVAAPPGPAGGFGGRRSAVTFTGAGRREAALRFAEARVPMAEGRESGASDAGRMALQCLLPISE